MLFGFCFSIIGSIASYFGFQWVISHVFLYIAICICTNVLACSYYDFGPRAVNYQSQKHIFWRPTYITKCILKVCASNFKLVVMDIYGT